MSLDAFCVCDSNTYPYFERERTARKQHRCYECGGKIEPGTKHLNIGGLCEGEWWHGRICPPCWDTFKWVQAHIPCVCFHWGNMTEELTEICREACHQAPGLLFGFYRRLIAGRRYHEARR